MTQQDRLRIALWTPLPPRKTGVADYVAELLPYLSREFDLEIFVDSGYEVREDLCRQYQIYPFFRYAERAEARPFDLNIYQMGNNAYHLFMYEQALRVPGLVVLHDLSLSFALYHYYAGIQGDLQKFREEFEYSEGQKARQTFDRLYAGGDNGAVMRFFGDKYMLRRLSERSYAFLTHLPYAVEVLRGRYPIKQVFSMYLGSADPFDELPGLDQQGARRHLGLEEEAFIIGVFGHLQATKQNDVALRAFARLKDRYPHIRLIFVGEINRANQYDEYLQGLIKRLGVGERVGITGYVSREEMQAYYLASDVVVNLRYPSFGQMSATLSRAIASGKPVIVTDLPEWRFLPEEFCWRVPGEDREGKALSVYLERLIQDRELVIQRGEAARRYYLENGTSAMAAYRLAQIIRQVVQDAPGDFPAWEGEGVVMENTTTEVVHRSFEIWDSLRAGGQLSYRLRKIRQIPVLGKAFYYAARLVDSVIHLPEIRRAEWQFFHSIVQELTQLRGEVTQLGGEVTQLRGELRQEYQPQALKVLDNPLGLIPGYQSPVFMPEIEKEDFYNALEAVFRGSPEIVQERQQQVWEQIKTVCSPQADLPVLDIGCGRGEFVTLLHNEGYRAIGVDINPTFLPELSKRGIEVHHQDALEYLHGLPDHYLQGIVAFHVIEHLDHPALMQLLELSYQKLMPGGFIYLETPNPICLESLSKFYTDPTHHRPIQPFQLAFLLEYHGFRNTKLLFLQPLKTRGTLSEERWMTLYQDYGALAIRPSHHY